MSTSTSYEASLLRAGSTINFVTGDYGFTLGVAFTTIFLTNFLLSTFTVAKTSVLDTDSSTGINSVTCDYDSILGEALTAILLTKITMHLSLTTFHLNLLLF